jgi:regulator of RNase E activity RraA
MAHDFLKDLERCQVATVVSTMFKKGLRARFFSGLQPMGPIEGTIVGEAFTIRAIPVREDMRTAIGEGRAPNMHRRSIAAAPDNKIIVFEGRGAADVSPLGDLIALSLVRRGIKAFITNAGANDIPSINKVGLPLYAMGPAGIPGSGRIQVADWNVPIGIGDVAVFPGDIIVADSMGAACIPAEIAADVAREALRQERMEVFIEEELNRDAPLETTYPPDRETLARFEKWLKANPV